MTRRIYETASILPDILSFVEVVKEQELEPLNPVEVAISEMQKTNAGILEDSQLVATGLDGLHMSLGGKIRGVVQADVGGGVRNYEVNK